MKPLSQDELFNNLKGFLKDKGIELQEGSYSRGIQKSCSLLSDAINLGQQGLDRAKGGIDKKLDQMRQVIHEKTAPRTPPSSSAESARQSDSKVTSAEAEDSKPKPKARRKPKRTK